MEESGSVHGDQSRISLQLGELEHSRYLKKKKPKCFSLESLVTPVWLN